jgi:hypothetical protein
MQVDSNNNETANKSPIIIDDNNDGRQTMISIKGRKIKADGRIKEGSASGDNTPANRGSWHGTTSEPTDKNNKGEKIEKMIIESQTQWNEGYGSLEEIGGRSEASGNTKKQ